ncbi:hypothetical protein GJAV_G00139560 [Gymnothorax javanicus]|nr:hypothetical protein GJAV_G00139560 [Gymnothorax javanicus]
MALRPGTGGAGSFMFPVGGALGTAQGVPMQPQQPQPGFPMVPVMQPNMQGIVGMNFGAQLPPGAIQMQGGMPMGMPMMGQPQFMGMRAPGPHYSADVQKQMVEDRQKHMEQQQRMLEEERKRRQFEQQKQKLRMLSSIKPKMGEKSRDDALEAIRGNLDGFSRDARMHPSAASSLPKNSDSSSSFHCPVPPRPPPPPAFPDDDEFSDFIQGPSAAPAPAPAPTSTPAPPSLPLSPALRAGVGSWPGGDVGEVPRPRSAPLPQIFSRSVPLPPASKPSPVAFSSPSADKGVGVFPSQEALQPMAPTWLYNDGLIPDLYKQVLEFTMTPAGIDTAKLYPILMSSGLPREALGQIWAAANRTTPGKLTKEELYTVLAMIGVTQSGLPATLEVLSQFPSPPVPNLSAVAMVLPQQPSMPPPVPVIMTAGVPQPMGVALSAPAPAPAPPPAHAAPPSAAAQPPPSFIASFPPAQESKPEDDDFQDFQEAPKAGSGGVSFTEFQGEGGASLPFLAPSQPQTSAPPSGPPVLMPVSGAASSSSDRYAAFKELTTEPAPSPPTASDPEDKYSIFRQLGQSGDQKGVGFGPEDVAPPSADDGFTSFKTADSVSPLEPPPSQATNFLPSFPPASPQCPPLSVSQQPHASPLSQPKAASLNIADLDLFSSLAPAAGPPPTTEAPPTAHPSAPPTLAAPSGGGVKPLAGGVGTFGDFSLFSSVPSSTSSSAMAAAPTGDGGGAAQDDFADFAAFGSSSESQVGGGAGSVAGLVGTPPRQRSSDKYDVFKQLSLELSKESGTGSLSSLRSEGDDLADFPPSRLSASLTASDRSLAGRAKEDCVSVKSLDLPSIGGSSAGREDSEDALSMQLDMKLSDLGGDLKHVMSDSSLELPSLSAPPPPAAEVDDLKFDPFGTSASGGMVSYDWQEKDELSSDQSKLQMGPLDTPSKEKMGGASEGVAVHPSPSKGAAFPTKDDPSGTAHFEPFADFVSFKEGGAAADDEFGDFAVTVADKPDSPRLPADSSCDPSQGEVADELGTSQGDKPKFDKFDFLKASSQAKVRSSEEMIQSELATFDLSVQDSQKRSHSFGEKEMGRSTPSPAPEQPHRDRSNTLSDKPALPVIRDKYKDLTGEVEESERYAYEWQRCLESALQVISKANNTLNSISSSAVCTEVIQSAQGMEYLLGVVEVYRVTKRVELGIKATAVCSDKLQELLKDVSRVWNNLMGFMSLAKVTPDESSLDFSSCILRPGIKNAKELACGVCLLNVDSRSKAFNSETDNFKLFYGGHQYHASCANFWINCVEPKPPGLILPDLL